MTAGSPTAALEPARPASPLKALSFWGAGGSSKAGRLLSLPRCQNYGPRRRLWARLSVLTRARR